MVTEKYVLALFGGTPGAISPRFLMRMCTMAPHLYARFPPNPSRFWGLITKKPSTIPKHTCVYLWSNFCIIIQRSISLHFVQFGNSTRLTGTSYGPVSVCLSVTSWCSIIKSDKNINLVLGMDVSFDQSYTVF